MTDPRTLTEPELLAIHAQLTTHGNPTPTTAHLAARSLDHIGRQLLHHIETMPLTREDHS